MLKGIKPKAEYELEIEGKTIKSSGVKVNQTESETEVRFHPVKPRIKPKAEYSVEVNE